MECYMSDPKSLAQLLRDTLSQVPAPEGYATLVQRLATNKPAHEAPTISESPENTRRLRTGSSPT